MPRPDLDLTGSKILVVDDMPANLDVLVRSLGDEGYNISVATGGADALSLADKIRPNLILLDVMMPDIDGYEVCRRLKADPALADTPVIFLTAHSDGVVEGFEAGGQDYITKPFRKEELLVRVRNQLERANLAVSLDELRTRLAERNERISVLLIDDQRIVGEAVRRMLADERDIDFHHLADPLEARRAIGAIKPSVILLDLVMPAVDGVDLLRELRAHVPTQQVPVIVLSSKEDPEDKSKAFGLGATDYLVKLPDRLEVVARIRHHARAYINLLQRQQAYAALKESQAALEKSSSFIRQVFGRYLSDAVVDTLLDSPDNLDMGGQTRKVTILMTDLRGFTAISEKLPPDKVVTLLNIYLSAMTDIIVEYHGTIDEFIGDAILAVFGAPVLRDDDSDRAIACAVAMQRAMRSVNEQNARLGLPEVAMGIGLNTGEVVVGNIGSEKRAKYAIVGRHVNLTARIESYTVGGQIFASEYTRADAASPLRITRQMAVEPKGVQEPLTVYEIAGIGPPYDLDLPAAEAAEPDPLRTELPVRYRVLEEKDAGGAALAGAFTALSPDGAVLRGAGGFGPLDNIKIILGEDGAVLTEELYAKIVVVRPGGEGLLRFTSVPPAAARHFADLLAARG